MIVLSIFLFIALDSYAQREIVWKGGTPGQESEWFCASNWIPERIPDEFSNVIIPDVSTSSRAYPEIKGEQVVAINEIRVYTTAELLVDKQSSLLIYGNVYDPKGKLEDHASYMDNRNRESIVQQ